MYDPEDDGIRGPVGEMLGAALHAAGAQRGFTVDYPQTIGSWVNEPWHGRELRIRWSPYGAGGKTTGYRWIAIRLSTSVLGEWADTGHRDADKIMGTRLLIHPQPPTPIGIWADDPRLSDALWVFAMRMAGVPEEVPSFAVLHVRNDGVVWHLRASRLDEVGIVTAIDLLERVARYGEHNDAALSQRLGRAKGVRANRRFELAFVVVILTAIIAVTTALFALSIL